MSWPKAGTARRAKPAFSLQKRRGSKSGFADCIVFLRILTVCLSLRGPGGCFRFSRVCVQSENLGFAEGSQRWNGLETGV